MGLFIFITLIYPWAARVQHSIINAANNSVCNRSAVSIMPSGKAELLLLAAECSSSSACDIFEGEGHSRQQLTGSRKVKHFPLKPTQWWQNRVPPVSIRGAARKAVVPPVFCSLGQIDCITTTTSAWMGGMETMLAPQPEMPHQAENHPNS